MKKTTIKFHPEDEDGEMRSVTTFHPEGSDMVADVSEETVRRWLWNRLEGGSVKTGDISGNEHGGFIAEFGKNNLVILSRALEEMRNEKLILSFSLEEDGKWEDYWVRNGSDHSLHSRSLKREKREEVNEK